MKKLLLFALLCLPIGLHAQQSGIILAAQATTTCSAPSNAVAVVAISGNQGGASFTVTANASGNTISFFASGDNQTSWTALNVTASNSQSPVTTTTGTGTFQANVAGYTHVCMEISALVSGTTTVSIRPAAASARAGGGSGLPAGGVTGQVVTNTTPGVGTWQSEGLLDGNGGSPVTTTPYTVQCDSAATILDRLHILRLQAGASVITNPQSSASGCGGGFSYTLIDDGAGTITVNRSGSDTFSTFNGITNTDGATSFTMTNGQSVVVNNGAGTVWEVRNPASSNINGFTFRDCNGNANGLNFTNTQGFGFWLPNPGQFGHIFVDVQTLDASHNIQFGIYNSSGTLLASTTAAALGSAARVSIAFTGGTTTFPAGKYYAAFTSASGITSTLSSGEAIALPFALGTLSASALPASITAPADSYVYSGCNFTSFWIQLAP